MSPSNGKRDATSDHCGQGAYTFGPKRIVRFRETLYGYGRETSGLALRPALLLLERARDSAHHVDGHEQFPDRDQEEQERHVRQQHQREVTERVLGREIEEPGERPRHAAASGDHERRTFPAFGSVRKAAHDDITLG